MTEETRMILDGIKNLGGDITSEISGLKTDMSGLASYVTSEVAALKKDVTSLKTDVSGLKADVSGLKKDVIALKTDMDALKGNFASLRDELENKIEEVKIELRTEFKKDIGAVEAGLKEEINGLRTTFEKRFGEIEKNIGTTRFILENEIRDNIRLVAEGHLDLNRKMEEVLKTNNEKEIMFMRLKYLESEVKVLKDKFGIA